MTSQNTTFCNFDTVEEINQRILARNSDFGNKDTILDARSEPTKYTFPRQYVAPDCIQRTVEYKTIPSIEETNINNTFKNYEANINKESILRNQVYALQNCPQSGYVPGSNSELYVPSLNTNYDNNTPEVLFPNLFYGNVVQNTDNLGNPVSSDKSLFNNDTRQQLKDS